MQLIMAEKDRYYKIAFAYMGNQHDALDALEEMIVIVYDKIDQLKDEALFYSWSNTILVNKCKALLRKQKKLVLVEEWGGDDGSSQRFLADNPYVSSEQQIDLQKLLLHLNPQQREAIQLRYFLDLDYQTIADITNVSLGTVKSRIHQGLQKLRDQYGGDDDARH